MAQITKQLLKYPLIMKKLFVIIGLATSLCACTNIEESIVDNKALEKRANPYRIPIETALQNAEACLNASSNGVMTRSSGKKVKSIQYKVEPALRSAENPIDTALYLVNYEGGGYALLGADSRLTDVYAYSSEGSLSWNDTITNKGLGLYLKGVEKQISDASGMSLAAVDPNPYNPFVKILYSESANMINPSLGNKITQIAPYNNFNPNVYIGCVPVSMSLIMSYYQWPMKCGSYNLDWNTVLSNGYSDGLGYMLHYMNALENLSSVLIGKQMLASPFYVQRTFQNLGYNANTYQTFSINNIINMLGRSYSKDGMPIISGQPVLTFGYGEMDMNGNRPGHFWVIDGYQVIRSYMTTPDPVTGKPVMTDTYTEQKFVHCIWGWAGTNNGFYNMSNAKYFEGAPDKRLDNENILSTNLDMYWEDLHSFGKITPNR